MPIVRPFSSRSGLCSSGIGDSLEANAEWQRKIAAFMFAQQKTREEARTEHGGRGVEKEGVPVHESEKHYSECLSAIVSYRERLREQQVRVRKGLKVGDGRPLQTARG